jgi:hypothetical protein
MPFLPYDEFSSVERTGDLEEAIQVTRMTVDATPEDHVDRIEYLATLCHLFIEKYARTRMVSKTLY